MEPLVHHLSDSLPPWRTRGELVQRCQDIVLSLAPEMPVVSSTTSALAQPIRWHPPDEGITLVEVFGGIGTGLAAVLEAGLTVRQYIHVDDSFV